MSSHCIGVTIVEKKGASPGDKMKIHSFTKKITFDPKFTIEGNGLTFPVACSYHKERKHSIE